MDDQAVEQAFARGKQTYPGIGVDLDTFRAHCQRVLGDAAEWDWKRFGTELFLCCGCARSDAEATRALEAETLPRVVKAISRIDSDTEFVEEALQILRDKLLVGPRAKIADYAARGPLVAWLSVAGARVALDLIRSRNARKLHHADLPDRLAQTDTSPLNDIVKSRYADSFQRALKTAISALPARDRNLLRLQLVGKCSIDQLGRMYLVHRATAARWLEGARNRVFESVREQMKREHHLLLDGHLLGHAIEEGSRDYAMMHELELIPDPTFSEFTESADSTSVAPVPEPDLAIEDVKGEQQLAEHLSRHGSTRLASEGGAVFQAGDVVGNRYVIERFLGRGAMGEVYLARDEELQHAVALKTPAAEVSDRVEFEQRLKREVGLARRIVHDNVCRVHDVNPHAFAEEWRAPVTYMTMEYLEGESLRTRVRTRPLSAAELGAVARQTLGALGAIHKAGILHRDLKSSNIMLCRKGEELKAVVMDFGLAIPMSDGASGVAPKSGFVGTPAYASPEQLRGAALTPASDLYSLGVVLFEAIAGRLPFAGHDDALLTAKGRHLEAIEWPEVDAGSRRFIETCLQPDSSARFSSAEAALRALDPPTTARPSRGKKGRARARNRPVYEPLPAELIERLDELTVERYRRTQRDVDLDAKIREIVAEASHYAPPQKGDVVLGAEFVELVGTGAFGDVWRATSRDGGEVAIKVFHSSKMGLYLALHQFRRGVRAMRQLNAAATCPEAVVRLLQAEPAQTVFSMPFADKLDLSHAMRAWPLEGKLALFREICEAVSFAHREGVLHRDIKPGNILITRGNRPLLADFDSCDFVHVRTLSAQPGGTLLFAAPEQLDGSVSRSLRSDVYSLGRLLHYLLLERDPPFRLDSEPALEDLQHQPAPIVQLIRRCTMRDLARRWQTVDELLSELDRCKASPPPQPAVSASGAVASDRHDAVQRVFISYVRTDLDRVKPLVARLQAASIPVWLDTTQLEAGQRWPEKIGAAIRSAALFVALFSRDGLQQKRSFMREELAVAAEEVRLRQRDRVWFVPVALDDVPQSEIGRALGAALADSQVAWLHAGGEDTLIETVRKHLR